MKEEAAARSGSDQEMQRLVRAIALYQRRADGEDVMAEARVAAQEGVSRTFLAAILLGGEQD